MDESFADEDADIAKPTRPRFKPNDPMYPLQWHLDAINAPEAWMHTRGRGAVVAVIDTGVAYGGALSAFVFPERKVVSVPSRRVHVKKNGWTAS